MTTKETWKPVTIGGITGIMMGAGTLYAIQSVALGSASGSDVGASVNGTLQVANPTDGLSFRQAFDAARTEVGPGGVFRWHGNIYSTYTKDEWEAMSEQEHEQFAQCVNPQLSTLRSAQSDASLAKNSQPSNVRQVAGKETATEISEDESVAEGTSTEDTQEDVLIAQSLNTSTSPLGPTGRFQSEAEKEPLNTSTSHPLNPSTSQHPQDNGEADEDVRVVGFGHVEVAEGRYVAVEEVDINGQRVAIIDVDNDGKADLAMSDLNHNRQLDEGEIIDLHTGESLTFTNESEPSDNALGEMAQDDGQMADNDLDILNITV